MRFRRREDDSNGDPADDRADDRAGQAPGDAGPTGPYDLAELTDRAELADLGSDDERIDLGGLLVVPFEGSELQLQVDEQSGTVLAALMVGPTGAVELAAFAAARSGDLWTDVRREIAADVTQRGGTATEQQGPFGPELACLVPVVLPDGQQLTQPSRVVGVEGPRWLLRATLLGEPAVEPEQAVVFEDAIRTVVVRRGTEAMAPGEPLPLKLPPDAQRLG